MRSGTLSVGSLLRCKTGPILEFDGQSVQWALSGKLATDFDIAIIVGDLLVSVLLNVATFDDSHVKRAPFADIIRM